MTGVDPPRIAPRNCENEALNLLVGALIEILHEEHRGAKPPRSASTEFINGNHEDFVWPDAQPNAEVLPGLHYLRNGQVRGLRAADETLRVGGIGGCFDPSDFERRSASLQGCAKSHYTRDEVDAFAERLVPLVRQIQAPQEQPRALGLFPNERELLACPNCGLVEDVLAGGTPVTNYGLPESDEGKFVALLDEVWWESTRAE